MRKAHVDYLRNLSDSISFEIHNKMVYPFKDRFLEIYPSEQAIIEKFPCCVLSTNRTENRLDKRFNQKNRIQPILKEENGFTIKYNRYINKHFTQKFSYQIDFWVKDPEYDILSTLENPGIIDQALLYISSNSEIIIKPFSHTENQIQISVDTGESWLTTGEVKNKAVYQFSLVVTFTDGLYKIEEEETLAGAILKIESPVDVIEL